MPFATAERLLILDLNTTLTPPEDVKETITISLMEILKLERKGRYFSCA